MAGDMSLPCMYLSGNRTYGTVPMTSRCQTGNVKRLHGALRQGSRAALSGAGAVPYTGRGGRRPGSGRPRGRKTMSHDKRSTFAARYPQHVTLRAVDGSPNLAREYLMGPIRKAIRASHKGSFRIVEFNVLGNHLHLSSKRGAWSSGVGCRASRCDSCAASIRS
jgi:hypothetical protein